MSSSRRCKKNRAQRQQYLDDACSGNETLRRHVQALLDVHDRAGNFLEEPLLGEGFPQTEANGSQAGADKEKLTETRAEATCPEPPLGFLVPPQESDELGRLGHYRVRRLLGQGSMGMVFLADDIQLQRPVALKVMRPELAVNPEGRQRFLREARAAAQVRSDHIVTIYHVDQEGDLPFLVMEVLRGQSLAEALEQGRELQLALCLKIARETAEGLAAAHAAGLIHRDVKPANIWLEEPNDRVKLLDFGLARARTGPLITQRHTILGTPAYMSPEQAAGRPLDARCDLFSLGAVLYHLLTGRRPFAGEDMMTVLSNLANEAAPPAADLVPGLPGGVADLLDRLLTKDPAGRPASAAAVANALLTLEQEASGHARSADRLPGPTAATAANFCRWRRLALAGGLGLAGLAIGLIVAVLAGAFHRLASEDTVPAIAAIPPATTHARPELPPVREFSLHGHGPQVQAMAFTSDSKTLVSAEYGVPGRGGHVMFWDMDRREQSFDLMTQTASLWCLAVDSQRQLVAVGHLNREIHLFRFGQRQVAAVLKGHTDRVAQLAFLKNGELLERRLRRVNSPLGR